MDLKPLEKDLAVANAKDESMLLALADGVIAVDMDGKIILANQSAQSMFGFAAGQLENKIYSEAIILEDDNGVIIPHNLRALSQALEREKTTTIMTDYFARKKDGSKFPVSISAAPILIDGNITGAIGIYRDISKEKQIDKAKTEFVSLASHQLRTPLSTINWYAEMLMAGDAGELNKEQKKYLNEIYEGNQRMVGLVNDLLNVSRIDLGTFSMEPTPTDIVALAKQVVQEQEPDIFKRKQSVVESYQPETMVMPVDPKLMRIIFQNLLSNAIKYTPERGSIQLTIAQQAGSVKITVADTGYGIPVSQQNNIFQKLFRADNVKAKDTVGTGLGLYLAKSIVEHSGGTISFTSVENQGTTFTITLPLAGMSKKTGSKWLT